MASVLVGSNRDEVRERLCRKLRITSLFGCWEFTGSMSDGYGGLSVGGSMHRSHRVAFEIAKGRIPDGLELDQLCRNRSCCNPMHLDPVAKRTNILRGFGAPAENARRTHCAQGHPLVQVGKQRGCPNCKREAQRRHYRANSEAYKERSRRRYEEHAEDIKAAARARHARRKAR